LGLGGNPLGAGAGAKVLAPLGTYFKKAWPPHGLFVGKVARVRPNAHKGRSRRVVYADGDVEDLTVGSVVKLARMNGEVSDKEAGDFERAVAELGDVDLGDSDNEEEIEVFDPPERPARAELHHYPSLDQLPPDLRLRAVVFHIQHLPKFSPPPTATALQQLRPFLAKVTRVHEAKRREDLQVSRGGKSEESEATRSEAKRSEAKRSEAKRSEAKRSEAKRSEHAPNLRKGRVLPKAAPGLEGVRAKCAQRRGCGLPRRKRGA
jgi:hypothetical protein